MQKVAAYLLERRDDMADTKIRKIEVEHVKEKINNWLKSKGASNVASSGTYQPEDGSNGFFSINKASDGDREWWMLQLHEDTSEGRRFTVALSITSSDKGISVYVTMETGWITTRVMPVAVDPRCPRIVRDVLNIQGHWYHGSSRLCKHQVIDKFEDGEELVNEIQNPHRAIPILLVSTRNADVVLPELDSKIAYDLTGLANVYRLENDASWALTDILGQKWSCYWGAVRLFWPNFVLDQDRNFHPLWTAERLVSQTSNPTETRDQLRKKLRGIVFHAAALSVIKPREIDGIRDAASRRTLSELRQRATSLEEYEQLADNYATENDQLRAERNQLSSQVETLEQQVAKLENDREGLKAHLRAARAMPDDAEEAADITPTVGDITSELAEPNEGEVRYYKKVYSRQNHDVMVHTKDCGCNNWQGAHSADKARKGISKLEKGRSNWKNMQHCGSCTGGGMWKVRW